VRAGVNFGLGADLLITRTLLACVNLHCLFICFTCVCHCALALQQQSPGQARDKINHARKKQTPELKPEVLDEKTNNGVENTKFVAFSPGFAKNWVLLINPPSRSSSFLKAGILGFRYKFFQYKYVF
jgi:hypothetical protein